METKNADLNQLKIDRTNKSDGPKSNFKNYIFGIVVLVILIILVIQLNPFGNVFSKGVEVELTSAVLQSSSQSNAILTASGYVVAQRKASVASKGTGKLVYLGVVEGDKVSLNQIIARIEDNDIKAQLEQAKANLKINQAELKEAENNYKRTLTLMEKNFGTEVDVEMAETRLNRIKAQIELANANVLVAEIALENTNIRAPFNGTVLAKNADVGEIVAPFAASINSKSAVVTIADMSSLQVEADVSESNIEKIKLNQGCEITLDAYQDQKYPGYVAKIVPTADRSKSTVLTKVAFKEYDSRVLPEMSAKVLFLSEDSKEKIVTEKPFLVIPTESIRNKNGIKVVYSVKENIAKEIQVTIGKQIGNMTEITFGLTAGDKIINLPNDKINDGIKIKIKE